MGAECMKGLNVDFCLHGTSHSSSCLDNTVLVQCSTSWNSTRENISSLFSWPWLGSYKISSIQTWQSQRSLSKHSVITESIN